MKSEKEILDDFIREAKMAIRVNKWQTCGIALAMIINAYPLYLASVASINEGLTSTAIIMSIILAFVTLVLVQLTSVIQLLVMISRRHIALDELDSISLAVCADKKEHSDVNRR
jgi:hypothetical protein